jgi:cellulose synthase (UDP-forming)
VVADRRELRRNPRLVVKRCGQVRFDFYTADASIENVSVGGCGIRVAAAGFVERPARTATSRGRLTIDSVGGDAGTQALDVVWTRTERDGDSIIIGLKFAVRSPPDYLVLADLMYGDAGALAKFLAKRRKHMGILRGSAVFLRWGACEPARAFSYMLSRARRPSALRFFAIVAPTLKAAAPPGGARHSSATPTAPADVGAVPPLVEAPSISPAASAAGVTSHGLGAAGEPPFGRAPLLVPRP